MPKSTIRNVKNNPKKDSKMIKFIDDEFFSSENTKMFLKIQKVL